MKTISSAVGLNYMVKKNSSVYTSQQYLKLIISKAKLFTDKQSSVSLWDTMQL